MTRDLRRRVATAGLALATAATVIPLLATGSAVAATAQTLVSNPSNQQGFVAQAFDCGQATDQTPDQAYVTGPGSPPLGAGSRQFHISATDDHFELFRTPSYDGLRLAELQKLEYSTYALSGKQPAALRLSVDSDPSDNGGVPQRDHSLFYIPGNNGTIVADTWQLQDVDSGRFNIDGDSGSGTGPGTASLAEYVSANPNAVLVNNNAGQPNGGAVAFVVGCAGAGQTDAATNVDRFVISSTFGGVTTYDFEPTSAGGGGGGTSGGTTGGTSPSPSASASASPTGSASTTPGGGGQGQLSTSTPDIQPNIQGILNASGLTPSRVYELLCYSRPSTTYFVARTATTPAGGTTLEFRILPGTNTRCYVRPQGNDALASNSVVINVHTTLSLSAVRTGVLTYIFQGRNLPRRSGQLITLYRVDNAGREIRTANLMTDASGVYRVSRRFTGTGTFQFLVRTSQTLTNAAGASNVITVTVR